MCKKEVNHHPHKHAERFQGGDVHTHRAGTHGWKQMKKRGVEKKGSERTAEREKESERERERKSGMGC